LLQHHGLSSRSGHAGVVEEFRSFETEYCGDTWYGDAMHGPKVIIKGRLHKAYLVSLMDDASRLIAHTAFCPGETALDVERTGPTEKGVLQKNWSLAMVRRIVPRAYRGSAPD
jgi:hypothetical protein